jgi:hypothetical protein
MHHRGHHVLRTLRSPQACDPAACRHFPAVVASPTRTIRNAPTCRAHRARFASLAMTMRNGPSSPDRALPSCVAARMAERLPNCSSGSAEDHPVAVGALGDHGQHEVGAAKVMTRRRTRQGEQRAERGSAKHDVLLVAVDDVDIGLRQRREMGSRQRLARTVVVDERERRSRVGGSDVRSGEAGQGEGSDESDDAHGARVPRAAGSRRCIPRNNAEFRNADRKRRKHAARAA